MNTKNKAGLKLPQKISNFLFNKLFGKAAASLSIYMMGRYIYNKMQVKNIISDIEVN
jgi:hypothetical protein